MTSVLENSPQHWRRRAREARALAYQLRDEQARSIVLKTADQYDFLAERMEVRAAADKPPQFDATGRPFRTQE